MLELRPGTWKLTVTAEPHRRTFRTITGNRDRAATELARLTAQHGHPPTTLDALVTLFFAHLNDSGRRASTLRRYEQLWRTWLSPTLAPIHPDTVRRVDVETALKSMAHVGQSPRSIHQAAVVLNTTFAWACEQRLTRANPVTGCHLPNGSTLTTSRRRC